MSSSLRVAQTNYAPLYTIEEILFPELQPNMEGRLKVSNIHSLWYAEYGNPHGIPVLVVHGGPGAGCGPNDTRFFDPSFYRIILLDQRGASRSTPRGEIKENTSAHIIDDFERLRKHLKINKWLLFGGSAGCPFILKYGETHPSHCLGFIIYGIFLGREEEYNQVWYGMKDAFPTEWEEMAGLIPPQEHSNLISAYHACLMSQDPTTHLPAAIHLARYLTACSCLYLSPQPLEAIVKDQQAALDYMRIFTHYCLNHFFFKNDQLLKNIKAITHLPCFLIQGRYDIICRPHSAYTLYKLWPGSQLTFIPDAGHSPMEPGTMRALIEASEAMKAY